MVTKPLTSTAPMPPQNHPVGPDQNSLSPDLLLQQCHIDSNEMSLSVTAGLMRTVVIIPVRNAGNDATGTPAHWGENVFNDEIMTPESSPPEESPISAMTIAALADLGYGVTLASAEPYSLPTLVAARASAIGSSVRSH